VGVAAGLSIDKQPEKNHNVTQFPTQNRLRVPTQNRLRACTAALLICTAVSTSYAQTDTVSLAEAALRGPAVASLLDMPRETPAQHLSAVFTLLDLGETDVAQLLWKSFSADDLEEGSRAALVGQFGPARFLNLARRESADGLTGARKFSESCLNASAQLSSDPKRLAQLIHDLGAESAETQRAARSDLAVTGDAGAIACLEALAQTARRQTDGTTEETDEKLRTQLLLTLAEMRPGVEPMLVAAIVDGRGQFRRDVVELAGYLHLQDAVAWLATIAAGGESEPSVVSAAYAALSKMGLSSPNGAAARAVVLSEIGRLEANRYRTAADAPWWSFDAQQNRLAAREVSADEQRLLKIARLARTLGQLPDATDADRRLMLIYAYQVSQLLEQPLPSNMQQWADTLGTAELSQMLRDALAGNQITAAVACCKLLGSRRDPAALQSIGPRRSPLAAAVGHADRELRYAALETVMNIGPTRSFAGASGVTAALWYFAASSGTPQAIAASSVVTRASDWAGQLRGFGYDATPVTTGRDALRVALGSPRLELMLVDSDIGRPLVREVIYGLRSNAQTARVPIAVLSSSHNLRRAQRISAQDRWLLATPRPHDEPAMKEVLLRVTESSRPDAKQRTQQAAAALGWIAKLLETGHPYDELLREAKLVSTTLHNAELAKPSLRLLAVLGTADSQQLLLEYVSNNSLPIETRREASDALAKSVERFGKLLTTTEITRQYVRYNASETADADTQQVLGQVLDILEK